MKLQSLFQSSSVGLRLDLLLTFVEFVPYLVEKSDFGLRSRVFKF